MNPPRSGPGGEQQGNHTMAQHTIVVMDGDQTGQELLLEGLRVLHPAVTKVDAEFAHYDLSLENRRKTNNQVVHAAATAMRETGLGLKAATITPETKGDVGSPNAILRQEIDGTVIVRTGRRLPGVLPVGGVSAPIAVVRMAVDDAYTAKEWRENERRRRRNRLPDGTHQPTHLPHGLRVRLPAGAQDGRQGLRRSQIHRVTHL